MSSKKMKKGKVIEGLEKRLTISDRALKKPSWRRWPLGKEMKELRERIKQIPVE